MGVEVGGAVKNVIAIGSGIADGMGFGANTRVALITRGLAEMMRLGVKLGALRETFMGLAGLGDLVLTCTDDQSRNRRFGMALGRGSRSREAQRGIIKWSKGVPAARAVRSVAQRAERRTCPSARRSIASCTRASRCAPRSGAHGPRDALRRASELGAPAAQAHSAAQAELAPGLVGDERHRIR